MPSPRRFFLFEIPPLAPFIIFHFSSKRLDLDTLLMPTPAQILNKFYRRNRDIPATTCCYTVSVMSLEREHLHNLKYKEHIVSCIAIQLQK